MMEKSALISRAGIGHRKIDNITASTASGRNRHLGMRLMHLKTSAPGEHDILPLRAKATPSEIAHSGGEQ